MLTPCIATLLAEVYLFMCLDKLPEMTSIFEFTYMILIDWLLNSVDEMLLQILVGNLLAEARLIQDP